MARRIGTVLAALMCTTGAGCARYVVIDPELVPSRNARDWTVSREPRPTTTPVSEPPPSSAPPPPRAEQGG